METKVINKEQLVYKTEIIATNVFVANDGLEFSQKETCLEYEAKLKAIEIGKSQFKELELNEYLEKALINSCFFDIDNESSIQLIIWNSVQDKQLIKEAVEFLKVKKFNRINEEILEATEFGKKYLIASWWEYKNSDSPNDYGHIIELTEAIKKIENLKNILEKCI